MIEPSQRLWRLAGGLSGFTGLLFGALSAHAVADVHRAALMEKASFYQLIHAVMLLWLSGQAGKGAQLARWLISAGTLLFCGTLYLKALGAPPEITRLAPLGGLSFMAAWLAAAANNWRQRPK